MHETIQYCADLLVGGAIIIAAICHAGTLFSYIGGGFGIAIIAFAIVGSNVASLISDRRGITIGEPDPIPPAK